MFPFQWSAFLKKIKLARYRPERKRLSFS